MPHDSCPVYTIIPLGIDHFLSCNQADGCPHEAEHSYVEPCNTFWTDTARGHGAGSSIKVSSFAKAIHSKNKTPTLINALSVLGMKLKRG